ncbi:amidase [Rubellicoccus peritrichatus]|uniref:Amidase n=1 Tax=Rubellicoccus peritrichatus TaxID=3080537 RepID=A0AAQ3LBZ0_9BACT|nr:amidase [Puniceicoccus sp. CR14]WOO42492.1 amidase [Puniceicoccus sp. CR14]
MPDGPKLTALEKLNALRSGEVNLITYLESICDLIEEKEPSIHAFVDGTYDRARILSDAEALLARFPDRERRPSLFGLALGVKDLIRVDGIPTRCGSKLPPELFDGKEADCVTRLIDAGAIVMGKTITPEFGTRAPVPTCNPYNLAHTSGGSSAGSAAGVASGFFPVAFGTQTVGSIIRPSAYCGVVGFKPSLPRIPMSGVIPFAPICDHAGVICHDISILPEIASVFLDDWQLVDPPKIESLTIGIFEGPYMEMASENERAFFQSAARHIESLGVALKQSRQWENIGDLNLLHRRMAFAGIARSHADWYREYGNVYSPQAIKVIEIGRAVPDEEYGALCAATIDNRTAIEQVMDDLEIDCWMTPATPDHAPHGHQSTGEASMNMIWTNTGMPVITIPYVFDQLGLPHGLQLVGRLGQDEALVEIAKLIAGMFPSIDGKEM